MLIILKYEGEEQVLILFYLFCLFVGDRIQDDRQADTNLQAQPLIILKLF
jgi:hypothetical protein